jgi:hypothetical protein
MPLASATSVLLILLGGILTVSTSCLLGGIVLDRCFGPRLALSRAERFVFAFGAGAACLSNAVFLLCSVGAFYSEAVWAVASLSAAAYWRWGRDGSPVPRFPAEPGQKLWWAIFVVPAAAYGCIYLVHAMAPEISPDGAGYHLGLVARYHREHGFPHITTNIYAYLSQGAEMLYLFAFAVGKHSAAKLVHFSFLVATVVAVLAFSRRHGLWQAGVVGAVLYACSPVVGADAASSYNDCALAFYEFSTFYALLLWWRGRQPGWLVIIGILAGFCFSIKYTGGLIAPVAVALVAWGSWRRLPNARVGMKRALEVAAVAALFVLPWTLKNAILVENPVAPFFNRFFPNPYVTISFEDTYKNYLKDYSHSDEPVPLHEYALELTVRGAKLQGMLGPIFLITPLGFLAWRRRWGKPILLAGVLCALPWIANAGTRFLIPSLVFASLAIGLALCSLPRRIAPLSACLVLGFHTISSWPSMLQVWHPEPVWSLHEGIPWRAALRLQPESEYLTQHVSHFGVVQRIANDVGPRDRVLSLEALPEAYFEPEQLVYYQGAENEQLVEVLRAGSDPQFWPARVLSLQWPARELHGFRVVQRNHDPATQWTVSEIRLRTPGGEVVSNASWRVHADPFPWTASRAFDGNPFTPWTSWEPLFDGMKVEAHFPKPLSLTGAELIYPWRQYGLKLEYFGKHRDGSWFPLDPQVTESRRPVSVTALRAAIHQELRRHHISFLVSNTAGGYADLSSAIAENPEAWGLREVGAGQGEGPIHVYKIE